MFLFVYSSNGGSLGLLIWFFVDRSTCIELAELGTKKSYFMGFNQVVYNDKDRERIAEQKASKLAAKGGSNGRKKGTKNTPKSEKVVYETAPFRAFKTFLLDIMCLLSSLIPELKMSYLVVDSVYGNLQYMKLAMVIEPAKIKRKGFLLSLNYGLHLPYFSSMRAKKLKQSPKNMAKK